MSNEVQLFSPKEWGQGGEDGKAGVSQVTERVRVAGVVAAHLPYSPPSHLAVFVGEVKVPFLHWDWHIGAT